MQEWMLSITEEKISLLETLKNGSYLDKIEEVGNIMISTIQRGNKILLAGNGGSAADAQHFAGEIVGRFTMERKALPAFSLCTDPSVVTCIANDYGYEDVFARQVAGLGCEGDIFVGISTSGSSKNIENAIEICKKKNIITVAFLGKDGGTIKDLVDYPLVVPSDSTPRIQEIHTLTVHMLCQMIEQGVFSTNE